MPRRSAILTVYFLLGAYAVCAQATLLREAQVLLFGSELSWGLVLAFWLSGVAVGAHAGGRLVRRLRRPALALVASGLAMPVLLAAEICFLRLARPILGVGPGEYVGLGAMFLVSLAATAPVSLWVGVAFPAASAVLGRDAQGPTRKARSVGWVYLAESAGSLVGGALFSFVLVAAVGAILLAAVGGAILTAAMLALAAAERARRAARIAAASAVAFAALAACAGPIERWTVARRWATFASQMTLLESLDSRYQNVAVGRLGDQYSLYTNGTVAATWPDHVELAVEAHLAACQAPDPRRILVLGGGAEGLLKELLRHRPERLDYVTLDRALFRAASARFDAVDRQALAAPNVRVHFADTRRFVKQAAAGPLRYDLVILAAAEPASALEARLYTAQCFGELARAMSERGVLAFALTGSVGYWGDAPAAYVGSIVGPLESVFPEVLLTFGYPTHVFAARRPGVLAETGETLARRYRNRGVASPSFDPLWFEGATDLLDPEKRAQVRAALSARPPRFSNTDEQPAAALYHMRLWLKTTGAMHAAPDAPAEERLDLLGAVLRLDYGWVLLTVLGATLLWTAAPLARGARAFACRALLWSVGTTGFAGMALEIVLLYTFQTLYGYVYSMVGLVVGVFMFGLVVGSLAMNRRLRRTADHPASRPGLRTVVALDLVLAVFAAALVMVLAGLRASAADWPVQVATFALVAVTGVLGGLVFPLAASVALAGDESTGRAAGAIDAADHVGGCLGALATGLVLVPVFGVSGACLAVAAMKSLSALAVGAAAARA